MNAIVTTTINPPTKAILKFSKLNDWKLYIVGDIKTPNVYNDIPNIKYLSPKYQKQKYKKLSDLIGWNCIQRRNIGFIEAFKDGAEIIATVDDDNIPYDHWGQNLLINKVVEIDCYENKDGIFDPLSVTEQKHLWHRGYPIQKINSRLNNKHIGKIKTRILVQSDLWNGDPDIDAFCRLLYNSKVNFSGSFPFTNKGITIFNSQNTFLHRSMFPDYCVLAKADRLDDIWGGILLQNKIKKDSFIAFQKPSVYQERNPHNIINDLEREIPGYYNTLNVIQTSYVCQESLNFLEEYRKYF